MSNEAAGADMRQNGALQLDRLVVGVDFSPPSIAAAGWVREHFAPGAACVIVHALDVPQMPSFLSGAFPSRDEVLTSARAGAAARLEQLRNAHDWGAVRVEVREGRAEDVLTAAAEETAADMVIVGEHAHPRSIWSTLGSTAEALVRSARVPILLARSIPDGAPRRILTAVDESPHARAALAWTRLLAQRFGASVTACHVFQPVFLGAARAVSGMEASAELETEQRRQTREWLEGVLRHSGFLNGDAAVRIEAGDPASALVAAQRGGGFDLVVIGSRGAGGAARLLLGSVANGVLRGASCPVLVVSDRDETRG